MDLQVLRADLHQVRRIDRPPGVPGDGEAVLRVDRFALTTNNITYAVMGDALSYWDFFPAEPGWGRIPVWGFGEVTAAADGVDLAVGRRCFGYLPMSSELIVRPGAVGEWSFADRSPHRAAMAGAYNSYQLVPEEQAGPGGPADGPGREELQMLLYPLFVTSFLIEDLLADREDFGAGQLVVSSASSKTAVGLAYRAQRSGRTTVVGLTSPAYVDFVAGLGLYDRVVPYDEVDAGVARSPSVYVDVAGDRDVLHAVHRHLGDRLMHSMVVGATHWSHVPAVQGELSGPAPEFFFAPARMAARTAEWGGERLEAELAGAWERFAGWIGGWLRVERAVGPDAVTDVYRHLLNGRAEPGAGHVCTLAAPRR